MQIHKHYVLDAERKPVAVQVPIAEFRQIEEVLENYGLAQLMDEARSDKRLSVEDAKAYYRSLVEE